MAKLKTNLVSFSNEVIESCKRNNHLGTARNYRRSMDSFLTFLCGRNIGLGDISEDLMAEYERWLLFRGVLRNSTSFYMRNLRAIYNKAVKAGIVRQSYPFSTVYTGVDKTRKRAASEELILRLQALDLRGSGPLSLARDLFIFSYCTRGMAFVDMAFLRKSDIRDGMISYVRRKTGQRLMVAVEPCMERIILTYSGACLSGPYVFPIIRSVEPQEAYIQYNTALSYYNRKLKRLATMLGEKLPLSSYVARHTWATTARNYNVPLSVISAGMGHSSEKTTRIYLAALDNSLVDMANRGIVERLNDSIST